MKNLPAYKMKYCPLGPENRSNLFSGLFISIKKIQKGFWGIPPHQLIHYAEWSRGIFPDIAQKELTLMQFHTTVQAGFVAGRRGNRQSRVPFPPIPVPLPGAEHRTLAAQSAPHPGRASAAVRPYYRPVAPGQRRSYSTETDYKYRPAFVL